MLKPILKLALLGAAVLSAVVLWQRAQLEVLALARIDPLPEVRALAAEERYAEAADHLDFFMAHDYVREMPEAVALAAEIDGVRRQWGYRLGKLSEGLVHGRSDEPIGQAAGVATDFLVIGDVRDLTREAVHWRRGEEVDEVVASLAAIGLAATSAQIAATAGTAATAGAAAPSAAATTVAKAGVSMLKTARKLGKLPPWLGRTLVRSARQLRQTGRLDDLSGVLGDLYRLGRTRGGLTLLAQSENAAALSRAARFAERLGPDSATVYRIGGKQAIRLAQAPDPEAIRALKLATVYGVKGLKTLDALGATRFVKYSARSGRVLYKGDAARLLAGWLVKLPGVVLWTVLGVAALVWIPWRRLREPGQPPSAAAERARHPVLRRAA